MTAAAVDGRSKRSVSSDVIIGKDAVASQLGANVVGLRRSGGLSQSELGELAGLHGNDVSLIERGMRRPRADVLSGRAAALGVEIEALLVGVTWSPSILAEPGQFAMEVPDRAIRQAGSFDSPGDVIPAAEDQRSPDSRQRSGLIGVSPPGDSERRGPGRGSRSTALDLARLRRAGGRAAAPATGGAKRQEALMSHAVLIGKPVPAEVWIPDRERADLHLVETEPEERADLDQQRRAFRLRCESIALRLAETPRLADRIKLYESRTERFTYHELSTAAALCPELMPTLNGEWEWIALTMADLD